MLEKLVSSKWGKRFISLAGGLFIGASILSSPITASAEEAVLTVLCHGIKGSSGDMNRIEDVVKDQSYVLNVDYPSTEKRIKFFSYDLDIVIRDRIKLLENKNVNVNRIVFVGHSMGGLVGRHYIECGNASFADVVSKVKAIVMIGTPNHGSPLADIVCYHAALAGERYDAIPPSIIEQTKGPKSDLLKMPSLTEPLHAKGIKGFLDVLTKPTTLINFVDSSWGRRAVYDLNSAPDGFIESELNKFGLKPGVYYCVVRGSDNNFATGFLIKGPSDGVVPAESADLIDKVSNKENYRLETVNANHLNITENKEVIRVVKEIVERGGSKTIVLPPYAKIPPIPRGWSSEARKVEIIHSERKETIDSFVHTLYKNTVGMEFVLIPPGQFIMSKLDNKADRSSVQITKPFYVGNVYVTKGQYDAVTNNKNIIDIYGENPFTASGPVEATIDDALNFCSILSKKEKITYRLPMEAEWEYVFFPGPATKYYFEVNNNYFKNKVKTSIITTALFDESLAKRLGVDINWIKSIPVVGCGNNVQELCQDSAKGGYVTRYFIQPSNTDKQSTGRNEIDIKNAANIFFRVVVESK
ncbi:SUMF1/EgtB/PvdO family nonheme iron enzyme [Candidatus Woesearchaeota archaeon]|nr:SUMF1/EgtB/PvdO family nonheme iron enzyme [Candidatus Woesearchaeota archaeon]